MNINKIFKCVKDNFIFLLIATGFMIIAKAISSSALFVLSIVMTCYIAFNTNL